MSLTCITKPNHKMFVCKATATAYHMMTPGHDFYIKCLMCWCNVISFKRKVHQNFIIKLHHEKDVQFSISIDLGASCWQWRENHSEFQRLNFPEQFPVYGISWFLILGACCLWSTWTWHEFQSFLEESFQFFRALTINKCRWLYFCRWR